MSARWGSEAESALQELAGSGWAGDLDGDGAEVGREVEPEAQEPAALALGGEHLAEQLGHLVRGGKLEVRSVIEETALGRQGEQVRQQTVPAVAKLGSRE